MDSKSDSNSTKQELKIYSRDKNIIPKDAKPKQLLEPKGNVEQICDENIITLQKIHAILLNCRNLSERQKCEFAESERYFMKLHLKKLLKKLEQK
ncbi:MAG: hypothetical protein ACFFB0_08575 [Promethearchaeota archaeon]